MSYLPIVERELRVSSRNWKSYWGRSGAACIAIVIAAGPICFSQGMMPEESGRVAFIALSSLAGFMCLWAGPATTADCLSVERREGTLGFLFLTDLRVYDIVIGKLAASSLRVAYSLAASVPVMALPMLMGGISFWEFLRVALVLGNILLFSLSTGILSSTIFKTAQNAVGWCVITLLTLAGGVPMFVGLWFDNRSVQPDFMWMVASPGFAFFSAFTENFSRLPLEFFISNSMILIASIVCLRASCCILPNRWQDRPGTIKRQRWREFWRNFQLGNRQWRAELRRRLLDINAFLWLASRIRHKRAAISITIGVLSLLWIWAAIHHRGDWLFPSTYMATAIGLAYLFRLAIASECVQPLAEARSLNSLELLLSTPLSPTDIIRGQWLAIKRIYLGPLLVSIGLMFLLFLAGLSDREMGSQRFDWVLAWICGGIVFVADLAAIFFVGMWSGLKSPNLQTGFATVLFKVMMLPWMLFGGIWMACSIATELRSGAPFEPPNAVMIILWCFISLSLDAWFTFRSKNHLQQRMRQVAMMRFQKPVSRWERLLGGASTSAPS